MEQYNFVGIDIAKDKFDVALKSNDRFIRAVFNNNISGFNKLEVWLKKHTSKPWVCLEATGSYSESVAEFLASKNIIVSVCNPLQIKNYAKSILARNKNDALDAQIIASYAAERKPRCFTPASGDQKYVRGIVQLIDTLQEQKQQLLNQLGSTLVNEIKNELKKAIKPIEKRIDKLEVKVNARIKKNSEQNKIKESVKSIKGIGDKTAHALIAYLPDIDLFKNAKQLAAYAGLNPKQHESGKFKGKTTLSKIGNARLRKALYMPALVVKNSNPYFKDFCSRLEKNGLKPKAIIGAVMRKLIHVIFGILKHKQDFNPALV